MCFEPVSPPPVGVSVLAVGVSNADMEELNKIAAPTSYKNIFYAPTFEDFPSIEREFIKAICSEELLAEFKLYDEVRQKYILYYSLYIFISSSHKDSTDYTGENMSPFLTSF